LNGEKSWNVFIKNLDFFFFFNQRDMEILDDMVVSKLSAKVFLFVFFFKPNFLISEQGAGETR